MTSKMAVRASMWVRHWVRAISSPDPGEEPISDAHFA